MMRFRAIMLVVATLLIPVFAGAQEAPSNDEFAPLVLVRIIPMPDVEGRFDHMAVDNRSGRLFAAVYGNDTVQVLDVQRGKRIHVLTDPGFSKPQMVAYIPESNRIVVANEGDGSCRIFDADSYKPIDNVKYSEDADQLRYDPVSKRIFVGYGDEAEGAIGMFDATTNKRVGDFVVGAHPESFQLEEKGPKIFVNLASTNQIAVIDRNTKKVDKWKLEGAGTNFPMALDEVHRRLFVAARRPARLLVLDMDTGNEIASLPAAIDTAAMSDDSDR